jgi:hypothetical protein
MFYGVGHDITTSESAQKAEKNYPHYHPQSSLHLNDRHTSIFKSSRFNRDTRTLPLPLFEPPVLPVFWQRELQHQGVKKFSRNKSLNNVILNCVIPKAHERLLKTTL